MDPIAEKKTDNEKVAKVKPSRSDGDLLGVRSIRFRTWLSFVMLTAITLIILWFAQIIFYTATFQEMDKTALKRAGDEVLMRIGSEQLEREELVDFIKMSAVGGGYSALVLSEDCTETILYANHNGSTSMENMDKELFESLIANSDFKKRVQESREGIVYTQSVAKRGDFVIYGSCFRVGSGKYVLCLVKPYVVLNSSVGILRNQLVVVTVICLLLSMLLALMFSRKITQPITSFSATARKLGKGDFTVRFTGNGMTEIDELADTLNYATDEMGKTETLRRDFFANVSHDLRTPLTMVRAYAEMIRDISGMDKEKREKHAQIIMDEADKLTLLVEDILELSRLQAGTEELTLEETDIAALLSAVIARFAEMKAADGFVIEGEIDCSSKVYCDSRRIEEVLYNLIANALIYTGEDRKVTVRAKETALCVRIEIADSGSGISKEEMDKVWDRYYRSSRTRRAANGTGLGLSIVKNILLRHDARFGVESVEKDEGEKSGTTFWFELKKQERAALPPPDKRKKK